MAENTKFNAKNLAYSAPEPAFLRRLRGEHGGDRSNLQITRPKKSRLEMEDEEDGPTMVDETGGVVTKEELEEMNKGRTGLTLGEKKGASLVADETERNEAKPKGEEGDGSSERQAIAEIGSSRKRRKVK